MCRSLSLSLFVLHAKFCFDRVTSIYTERHSSLVVEKAIEIFHWPLHPQPALYPPSDHTTTTPRSSTPNS